MLLTVLSSHVRKTFCRERFVAGSAQGVFGSWLRRKHCEGGEWGPRQAKPIQPANQRVGGFLSHQADGTASKRDSIHSKRKRIGAPGAFLSAWPFELSTRLSGGRANLSHRRERDVCSPFSNARAFREKRDEWPCPFCD